MYLNNSEREGFEPSEDLKPSTALQAAVINQNLPSLQILLGSTLNKRYHNIN